MDNAPTIKIDVDTKLLLAIERLHTGLMYGSDMLSSKKIVIEDVQFLMDCAIILLDRSSIPND